MMTKETILRVSRISVFATVMLSSATLFAGVLIPIAQQKDGEGFLPIQPVTDGPTPSVPNTENDWTGTATGNISTTTNWSLGHVPTSSEDAVFTSSSNGTGIRGLNAA